MKWITGIIALVLMATLTSCDESLVDSGTQTFPDMAWPGDDEAVFEITPPDTLNTYDINIRLRNNANYAYKNLWLITQMKFPQGKIVTDTLEYDMANAQGEFLGSGQDVVENKLGYRKEFRFRESGTYQLSLQQAMRKSGSATPLEQLEGVLDVGYTIEKEITDGSK
ncbi:gliding motility lipoprotein GldH [Nonlabens marinus]|uniref:Gliding motility protein GldH n=1 Tax=Nonlabens marinus S1-08 TaxID=1454201 RepID=W8VUZ8_9FLAO|nr:gliding motility lipoprotein GldH [Nonlabens marinus]BAO55018.1 gliding motility protein GldH [Nonlabens marinus S1-08]